MKTKHGVKHPFGEQCAVCKGVHPESHVEKKRATYSERKKARRGGK